MRIAWILLLAACGGGGKGGGLFDAPGMPIDAAVDTTGFQCADDSTLEGASRNDTVATAYVTPVDTNVQMVMFAGLAICPATDKDHYRVTVSAANRGIELVVEWDPGPALSVSLLNAGGATIANGAPMGITATRACVANLPQGTYYGAVFGSAQNNYRLTIKTVQGC